MLKLPPLNRAIMVALTTLLLSLLGITILNWGFIHDPRPKQSHLLADIHRLMVLRSGARICGSPKITCIANLKQIDGAKQQWAIENRMDATARPIWRDLIGTNLYIKVAPVCPSSGYYTIGAVDQNPRCTEPEHCL